MIKRAIKMLICGALAATAAVSSAACSLEAESAYDIAVKYGGFQGTEQEWLASLKGADGKDADSVTIDDIYESWLKKDGNAGKTFNEFLSEYLTVDYNENNDTEQIAHNLNSVVSIYCAFRTQTSSSKPGYYGGTTTSWALSAGSGVIYSLDRENGNAYIITNYHVVYESGAMNEGNGEGIVGNDNIYLYLYGIVGIDYMKGSSSSGYSESSDKAIKATYVGGSMAYDIAVLQVSGDAVLQNSTAEAATFSKNGLTAGEKVYAIGNASGEGISVSMGIISVESEYISMYAADGSTKVSFHVLRTDAAINAGNSGGGLFNAAGELVGIVNAKTNYTSDGTSVENEGYALPISDVGAVAANIVDNATENNKGAVYKAYFGITTEVTSSESEWNDAGDKLEINEVLRVSEVKTTSSTAGLGSGVFETGDKILSVRVIGSDGEDKISVTLGRRSDFNNAILYARAGDTIEVVVRRGLEKMTLKFENLKSSDLVEADAFAKGTLSRLSAR